MPLKAARFAGDKTLEQCLDGTERLKLGSKGPPVFKVQQALIESDLKLLRFGVDGKFGMETANAVIAYQKKKRLKLIDGVVGPETMGSLDSDFSSGGSATPVGFHWGVDSAGPATFELRDKNGVRKKLFDIVADELGMPEFWGRYLFKSKRKGLGVTPIDTAEADFIFKRSDGKCRILLIDNIAEPRFKGSFEIGREDALAALRRCGALQLNVPRGVFVYADIEPQFQCSTAWFLGWFHEMQKAGRGRGGLYEAPQELGFKLPYREALRQSLDILSRGLNANPPFFLPDPPHTARLLWSQRPMPFFKKDIDPGNFKPKQYRPAEPDFIRGMTVIWQYGGNCRIVPGNRNVLIDMNLATPQGLASMWNGKA